MRVVTRELKIALLIGFCLVLVVSVLIADHLSAARTANLADAAPGIDTTIVEPDAPAIESRQAQAIRPGPLAMNPAPASDTSLVGGVDNAWNLGRQTYSHAMAGAVPVAPPAIGMTPGQNPAATTSSPVEPEPMTIAQGAPAPGTPGPGAVTGTGAPPLAVNVGDSALADVIKNLGGKLANGEITPPAAMSTETQPKAPELPVRTTGASEKFATYTVASGDSLYKIAKKVYGKGELWKTLADANQDKITPTGNLKVGTTLKVPSIAGATTLAAAKPDAPAVKPEAKADSSKGRAQAKGKGATYTIKPGDNLGDIAKRTLGSSKRVGDILAANKGVLDDADSIRAGLVIQIPAK